MFIFSLFSSIHLTRKYSKRFLSNRLERIMNIDIPPKKIFVWKERNPDENLPKTSK